MATVNLGRIKPQWQGTYASETSYVVDDMVLYNNSAYICTAASQGNAPTNTSYWDLMTQGSDIPTGATSGQLLTATGSSTFSWQDAPSSDDASALTSGTLDSDRMEAGAVIQVVRNYWNSQGSFGINYNVNGYTWTGSTTSITPKRSGSHFLLIFRLMGEVEQAWNCATFATRNGSRVNSVTQAVSNRPYGDWAASISYNQDFSSTPEMVGFSTIDTAGSVAGTAISYEARIMHDTSRTVYYNRDKDGPDETFGSEVIIMEIAQ